MAFYDGWKQEAEGAFKRTVHTQMFQPEYVDSYS